MTDTAVAPCAGCPRQDARAVATRGPVPARLLFLSGAPRHHEEQQGSAFASPACGWLEQTLAECGLDPTGVHYATLIGCRPPHQRPMRPDEIEACAPRLERTINAVAPEVIVLCGADVVSVLLPGVPLGTGHGQLVTRDRRRYFPLRHPYAALHSDHYIDEVKTDLRRLAALLAAGLPEIGQAPEAQLVAMGATQSGEPRSRSGVTEVGTAAPRPSDDGSGIVSIEEKPAPRDALAPVNCTTLPRDQEVSGSPDGGERGAAEAEQEDQDATKATSQEQDGPAQLSLF